MIQNYASLTFTTAVKNLQEKAGSRRAYARIEKNRYLDGFSEKERLFVEGMDSFYLATISENGYPYIQHRGGPKGFIKVLTNNQLGIVDFAGNSQFISVGNLATNEKVALILVDYAARARLKILGRAKIIELTEDPNLFEILSVSNQNIKPERMIVFTIDAYDWNCPQHITPRYEAVEGR